MSKNYYKILEIDKTASKDEIKKSFRELSKKHHPDVGGDENKFKEINEAYSILSDDKKRSKYDNPFENNVIGGFGFRDFFKGGFPFRRQGRNENVPMRGKDLQYIMVISLYESICGIDREMEYNFEDICDKCKGLGGMNKMECGICKGTGFITETSINGNMRMVNQTVCGACNGRGFNMDDRCETCGGSGIVEKNEKIVIKIYPNVAEGSVLSVAGKGNSGKNGGPNGNLLVKLKILMPKKEDITEEQLEILKNI